MKKQLFFLLIALAGICNISMAQDCKCNPNGFNPFVYSYLGETATVRTGHQFGVKCKTPVSLNGGYKCSYNNKVCNVKLKAVIKNGTGEVVKEIPEFNFPLEYEFETSGNYTVEITPNCGGVSCAPAKFYFTVTCAPPVSCKCNPKNGWDKFTFFIGKTSKQMICGSTITLKKDQFFAVKGGYKCIGNCDVVLNGKLTNSKTGDGQDFPNFKLDGVNFPFAVAGSYKLLITPVCGGNKCAPCGFYINVEE